MESGHSVKINMQPGSSVPDGHFPGVFGSTGQWAVRYDQGSIGIHYILGDHNLTLKQIFIEIAASTGRPAPRR